MEKFPPEQNNHPRRILPEVAALGGLLVLIALAWCVANSKWTFNDWHIPGAYLEGRESDVIGMLATFKAAADGNFVPLGPKRIPELGAPGVADWRDIPTVEEIPVYLTGLLARWVGLIAALNIKLLVAHLLAGVTFYLVARYFRCSLQWAFLGGLAYGLAPFIFSESPHHSIVAYAWHIPLFLVVWNWAASPEGIQFRTKRFWFAAAVAFITGLQNVYYTNVFCQLVLLAGLLAFVKNRQLRPLLGALGVIGAAALAFFLMGLDTWLYQLDHGKNPGAIDRPYHWLEVYALKPIDLVIPPPSHQIEAFQSFSIAHSARVAVVNEGSYLGLLGIGSLLWIFGSSLVRALRKPSAPPPPELWQILWIFAVFCTGGLNAFAGAAGLTVFRAGYRVSIVILAIALMFAVRQATHLTPQGSRLSRLVAILLAGLVLLDQVPRQRTSEQIEQTTKAIQSDREWVLEIESFLPEGAMVLLLPPMDYPESPIPGIFPYDHLRPYLYSQTLRYSFGAVKGREPNPWVEQFAAGDLDGILSRMRALGFAALAVNRKGFRDGGENLLDALRAKGPTREVHSQLQDFVLFTFD